MTAARRSSTPSGAPPSRRPVLTGLVAGGTLVISLVALLDPAVMDLLVRDRPLLLSGQWWRAATPVLVQPDGWGQLAFNVLGLVLVGAAVQRRVGPGWWAAAYLAGGVGSVAIYSAWHPADTGGGSSAAVAALIGLLMVTTAARSDHTRFAEWAQLYAVFFAVYLTAFDLGGVTASVVAGNASILLTVVARRALGVEWVTRIALVLVIAAGLVMTLAHDDHGTGILIGLTFGALAQLRPRRWAGRDGQATNTGSPLRTGRSARTVGGTQERRWSDVEFPSDS